MPAAISYHRALAVEEAVDLLGRLGDGARVIAGGQSLMVMINLGLASPAALVDIDRVPGLDYVERDGRSLRIGALTRHAQLERYEGDLGGFGVLKRTAPLIAYPAIRERGTFGGTLAHADPTGEWCVLARLLDAEVVALGDKGTRVIPAGDFFRGLLTTSLEPGEVITEIRFPREPHGAELLEVEPRHPDVVTLIVAVAFDLDGESLRRPRIALGGVVSEPLRLTEVEAALEGVAAGPDTFAEASLLASRAVGGSNGEGGRYVRTAVATLVERALHGALARVPSRPVPPR